MAYTLPDLDDIIAGVKAEGEFVLDLETTQGCADKPDPRTCHIIGVVIATSKNSWWLPFINPDDPTNTFPYLSTMRRLQRECFHDPQLTMICHNLKFDWGCLDEAGFTFLCRLACSMVAYWMVDESRSGEGERGYGLKESVEDNFGHVMLTFKETTEGKGYLDGTEKRLSEYAMSDGTWTVKLWRRLKNRIKKEGVGKCFWELEMPVTLLLSRMERGGLPIDVDYLGEMAEDIEVKRERALRSVYKHAGETFNLNSPIQVANVLYDKLGLPTKGLSKGKNGAYPTNIDVLKKLQGKHAIIDDLVTMRGIGKLLTTYIKPIRQRAIDSGEDRLRSSFFQTGTKIGRLSSGKPVNFQNFPRDKDSIRRSVSARKGFVLVGADYQQIELKLMAHWSRDPVMIEVYGKRGVCDLGSDGGSCKTYIDSGKDQRCKHVDLHLRTAEESGCNRNQAKGINFGLQYGMYPKRLMDYAGIPSLEDARAWRERWFEVYQGVWDFHRKFERELRDGKRTFSTITGRKRRLWREYIIDPIKVFRQSVQFVVSGSSQDIIKLGMRNIERTRLARGEEDRIWIEGCIPLIQVHDELMFEVREDLAEEALKMVTTEMENVVKLRVPLTVDGKIGQTWDDVH